MERFMDYKVLSIRMGAKKHTELKILSLIYNKTLNFLINQAVREFLIKHGDTPEFKKMISLTLRR